MGSFRDKLNEWDSSIIEHTRRLSIPVSRFAIFVVYFWFGALKVFTANHGAAGPLVSSLMEKTFLAGISPESFLVAFGILEMLIGLIFIIPHLERLGIFILALHLLTTIMPLFLLPDITWERFLVPTIEGQYIIKNVLIVALALGILGHLRSRANETHV